MEKNINFVIMHYLVFFPVIENLKKEDFLFIGDIAVCSWDETTPMVVEIIAEVFSSQKSFNISLNIPHLFPFFPTQRELQNIVNIFLSGVRLSSWFQ